MQVTQNRRRFLAALSSAGAAGLIGAPKSFAQEPAPETTAVRFPKYTNNVNNVCGAPLYVMDELLRAEGFTDIRYIATDSGATGVRLVASGEAGLRQCLRRNPDQHDRCRRPDQHARRPAHRMLRAVCQWRYPRHPRPEG